MTNKSTFSILFVAQKRKLKATGKAPILARVTVNGEMVHLATRIDVDPDRWLGKECRTPGRSAEDKYINEMLDNYRNVIKNKYNELFFRGEAITAMRLKSILTSRSDEAKRLLVLFDEFNEDYRALVGKETTHKTYTRYLLTRRRLAKFMAAKYKIKDILLSDINTKFINDFYIYLRTVDGKNGHNYHMKMIQRFRTVFKTAKDNGWVTADPFGGFKISMEETHREHLTIDELGALISKEMTSERLQRVKDIFVFSCFTGLAYTDVRGLKKSEVVMGNDGGRSTRADDPNYRTYHYLNRPEYKYETEEENAYRRGPNISGTSLSGEIEGMLCTTNTIVVNTSEYAYLHDKRFDKPCMMQRFEAGTTIRTLSDNFIGLNLDDEFLVYRRDSITERTLLKRLGRCADYADHTMSEFAHAYDDGISVWNFRDNTTHGVQNRAGWGETIRGLYFIHGDLYIVREHTIYKYIP